MWTILLTMIGETLGADGSAPAPSDHGVLDVPVPSLLSRHIPASAIGEPVTWRELGLCGPRDPATKAARTAIVAARVQVAAAALAVLTLLWIPFDLALLDSSAAWALAIGRVGASVALAALSSSCTSAATAPRAVSMLYVILLAFYLAALAMLWRWESQQHAFAITVVYVYLPFVVIAGMAIFPLTISECAGLGIPWLAVASIVGITDNVFAHAFTLGILWLLAVIGSIAAIAAVSQLQFLMIIFAQSSRDALTGALTRRVGAEILAAQVEGARRRGSPLSVVLMDLDHFKAVNDGYGHHVGDLVLASTGKALRTALRGQDSVIRWGGEEFVMVLPESDTEGARRALARLARHGLAVLPDGSPQTASFGIAELNADAAVDGAALVALADSRMYQAKDAGRNRVVDSLGAISTFQEEIALRVGGDPIQPRHTPSCVELAP